MVGLGTGKKHMCVYFFQNTFGQVLIFLQVLTGLFLASIRHSCLLCQLCLEHCFDTVRMRLKVTQSIVVVVH